jgi:hypothetical protein
MWLNDLMTSTLLCCRGEQLPRAAGEEHQVSSSALPPGADPVLPKGQDIFELVDLTSSGYGSLKAKYCSKTIEYWGKVK